MQRQVFLSLMMFDEWISWNAAHSLLQPRGECVESPQLAEMYKTQAWSTLATWFWNQTNKQTNKSSSIVSRNYISSLLSKTQVPLVTLNQQRLANILLYNLKWPNRSVLAPVSAAKVFFPKLSLHCLFTHKSTWTSSKMFQTGVFKIVSQPSASERRHHCPLLRCAAARPGKRPERSKQNLKPEACLLVSQCFPGHVQACANQFI